MNVLTILCLYNTVAASINGSNVCVCVCVLTLVLLLYACTMSMGSIICLSVCLCGDAHCGMCMYTPQVWVSVGVMR